jgi:hypothetical protein
MEYDDKSNLIDNLGDNQDETMAATSGNVRFEDEDAFALINPGNTFSINNADIGEESEENNFDNSYRNIR